MSNGDILIPVYRGVLVVLFNLGVKVQVYKASLVSQCVGVCDMYVHHA